MPAHQPVLPCTAGNPHPPATSRSPSPGPSPPAPQACVLPLALGISRALSHLHAKRIVHGDLNPNNVLLARDAASPCGWATKVGAATAQLVHNVQQDR